MSVQLLLRQRASTKHLIYATSVIRSRSSRRLYSAQHSLDEHPYDVSVQAGPSNTDHQHTTTEAGQTLGETSTGTKAVKPKKRTRQPKKKSKEETEVRKPSRSLSDPSRVENFLSSIAASGQDPTIEDIERHRPEKHAQPESAQYAEEYNALVDTLGRSFTKEQLHRCLNQYGARVGNARSSTKLRLVKAIIEDQWGWPSLEKVEKDKRDRTEVIRKRVEITPSELFIILGRDGEVLHQLSSEHKIQVSVKQNPLSLDLQGVRISLEKFHEIIRALRKNIVEETFHLPTAAPIPSELRQRISRLADAYLENVGDNGLVRICAKSQAALTRAKRFTIRAMSEIAGAGQVPIVTHLAEPNPAVKNSEVLHLTREYGLYPFVSPRPLPWHVDVGSTFRVRKVAGWLFPPAVFAAKDIGLGKGSRIVIANDGTQTKLKELLLSRVSSADGHHVQVKARLGHVLFSTKPSGGAQPFLGPLRGGHSYNAVRDWMSNYDSPMFVPSLPTSLTGPSPSGQKILHRLNYRLLKSGNPTSASQTDSPPTPSDPNESITLEIVLALPKQPLPLLNEGSSEPDSTPLPLLAQYTNSVEYPLDVMLPDRAMDVRFVVSEAKDLSESEQPPALREYAVKLHAYATDVSADATEPDPPHSWTSADGKTYVLHGCSAVRQHTEPSETESSATSVVVESLVDLDSRQKGAHCEVICTDPGSDAAWSELMKGCDKLALSYYAPSASSLHQEDIDIEI